MLRLDSAIRTRCVGYYFDKDKAILAVITNDCDISEQGHFRYAIIHPVLEGIHSITPETDQNWFEYSQHTRRFDWVKKPDGLKGLAFAGIG